MNSILSVEKKLACLYLGGFVIENAFRHVFGRFDNVPCLILEKEITDEQYDDLQKSINEFIVNKDSLSYDLISLALANTNYSWVSDTKYFCSQFVTKLLNDIDIETPKKPEHMHPMDFTKINGAKIVFEGDLKNFCNIQKNGSTVFA